MENCTGELSDLFMGKCYKPCGKRHQTRDPTTRKCRNNVNTRARMVGGPRAPCKNGYENFGPSGSCYKICKTEEGKTRHPVTRRCRKIEHVPENMRNAKSPEYEVYVPENVVNPPSPSPSPPPSSRQRRTPRQQVKKPPTPIEKRNQIQQVKKPPTPLFSDSDDALLYGRPVRDMNSDNSLDFGQDEVDTDDDWKKLYPMEDWGKIYTGGKGSRRKGSHLPKHRRKSRRSHRRSRRQYKQ